MRETTTMLGLEPFQAPVSVHIPRAETTPT
jgi:hypothetical protein